MAYPCGRPTLIRARFARPDGLLPIGFSHGRLYIAKHRDVRERTHGVCHVQAGHCQTSSKKKSSHRRVQGFLFKLKPGSAPVLARRSPVRTDKSQTIGFCFLRSHPTLMNKDVRMSRRPWTAESDESRSSIAR